MHVGGGRRAHALRAWFIAGHHPGALQLLMYLAPRFLYTQLTTRAGSTLGRVRCRSIQKKSSRGLAQSREFHPQPTRRPPGSVASFGDALGTRRIIAVNYVLLRLLLLGDVDVGRGQQQPLGVSQRRVGGGSVASGPRAKRMPKEAARGGDLAARGGSARARATARGRCAFLHTFCRSSCLALKCIHVSVVGHLTVGAI